MDIQSELIKARNNGYAVGAFNTANLEVTKAICAAAKETDKIVVIQTTPSAIEYAGLETLYNIVRDEVENSGAKAILHLDHGKDFETVKKCVDIGYDSVMFDGSRLPYGENIIQTKKVVQYAHDRNVAVEAEIGVIGKGEDQGDTVTNLSTPDQVAQFVKETGIDSVAVSVGNQHGAPKGEKIDLELLAQISQTIDIPLVMHGASGLSNKDIKEAINLGVAKFNIDTKIKKAFSLAIENSNEEDYRKAFEAGMEEVEKIVVNYIELFSGSK